MHRFAFLLSLGFAALPVCAQTTHTITASGMQFSPSTLTINAGDTVTWENTNGIHNVNGSVEDYPSNPEGFSNGTPAPAPWTFSFTFNTPGVYGFNCDQHGAPGSGMSGTITVEGSTGVEDERPAGFSLESAYPNPFRGATAVSLTLERPQRVRVAVYDAAGREIAVLHDGSVGAGAAVRFEWMPQEERSGVYLIRLQGATFEATQKVIRVR